MAADATPEEVRRALASERQLVRTLGGFELGIAGAELVTHERIPIPRFNFVEVRGVSPERRTAFFERVLDHYFQRAIRPTFRVPWPPPSYLDEALRALGFRPRPDPFVLLTARGRSPRERHAALTVRAARADELDSVIEFWAEPGARPELRSAIDVAWHHPNPGELLTPFVAVRDRGAVAAALVYEHGGAVGVHFVTTRPSERGQGLASALVVETLAQTTDDGERMGYLFADSSRLERRLVSLGLERAFAYRSYDLPPEAELSIPSPGPPTPPRWRPPRAGRA